MTQAERFERILSLELQADSHNEVMAAQAWHDGATPEEINNILGCTLDASSKSEREDPASTDSSDLGKQRASTQPNEVSDTPNPPDGEVSLRPVGRKEGESPCGLSKDPSSVCSASDPGVIPRSEPSRIPLPEEEVSPKRERLAAINFALPAVEYTDAHVNAIIDNDLSVLQTSFFLQMLGSMNAETGVLHAHRVNKWATKLECHKSCFYGKHNLIDAINATGEITLYIKNKKIHGRVHNPPKKRGHKNPLYSLSVSMTHRICLQGLLTNTEATTVIRMMLMLSMHCDLSTGEINVEKRAIEWGEMIGRSRTSAERAIDWITEHGYAQLERDYIVSGHLNYTAMAKGYLTVFAEQEKQRNAEAKADRKAGKPDYKDIEIKLYKYYGLNAKNWMESTLREAAQFFLGETFDRLEQLKRHRQERQTTHPSVGVGEVLQSQFA